MSGVIRPIQPPVGDLIPHAQQFLRRHCNITKDPEAIPTGWRWGFVVYRTVYTPESDAVWTAAVAKLEAYLFREIDRDLSWRPPPSWTWKEPVNPTVNAVIRSRMRNLYLSDQQQYDGLSVDAVRERFIALTRSWDGEEEHDGSNGPLKWEFCLVVDEDVLRSLVDAPEPVVRRDVGDEEVAENQIGNPGYVKVVDQSFDTTEEPASRNREDYTGWMKASLDCLWMLYDLAEMELECPYRNEEMGEFPVWDGGLPRREPYPPLGGIRPTDEEEDNNNDDTPPRGTQGGGTGRGTQRGPATSTIGGTQRGPPGGVQRPRPQLGPGDHPYNPNIRNQPLTPELIAAGQAAAAKLRERENEKKRKMEEAEERARKAGKLDDGAAST